MNFDVNEDAAIPLDLLLAETEESFAAVAATMTDEELEEFDSIAKGEVYHGGLSARVSRPTAPVINDERDSWQREEESFDDVLDCATHGIKPPDEPTPIQRAVAKAMASPAVQSLKKQFIQACQPGFCHCGEGTARTEDTVAGWRKEYDASGSLVRAYQLNP